MIVQIFGEGTSDEPNVSKNKMVRNLIKRLRADYLESGGTAEEFPEYLASNGITVSGSIILVDEKWDTFLLLQN